MELATRYLGLKLENPLICGASPLVNDPERVRRLAAAGISAFVLHSLFEEDIAEKSSIEDEMNRHGSAPGEAGSYFSDFEPGAIDPQKYLRFIGRMKELVSVPVIASLNGSTPGGWTGYAREIEKAGADALELNVYFVSADPEEPSRAVEARTIRIVEDVKSAVSIPVAVKLSPYYSAFADLARRLDGVGADGLVLFNRFYQPDLEIESFRVVPRMQLSTPEELRLRIRWLAILYGKIRASLAATGGIHGAEDVIKATLAGADAVQLVSTLLEHGPEQATRILEDLRRWLGEHRVGSLSELRGKSSLSRSPSADVFERASYIKVLQSWKP